MPPQGWRRGASATGGSAVLLSLIALLLLLVTVVLPSPVGAEVFFWVLFVLEQPTLIKSASENPISAILFFISF